MRRIADGQRPAKSLAELSRACGIDPPAVSRSFSRDQLAIRRPRAPPISIENLSERRGLSKRCNARSAMLSRRAKSRRDLCAL